MQVDFHRFAARVAPQAATLKPSVFDVSLRGLRAPQVSPDATEVDFHADVQRQLVQSFKEQGHSIEEHIRLISIPPGPEWIYDTDFVMKPVDGSVPVVVEIKTSVTKKGFDQFDGTEFRRKQFQVLILVNLGGHVKTNSPRIVGIGLPFGIPLPPLAVMLIYALPGKEYVPVYVPPGDLTTLMKFIQ